MKQNSSNYFNSRKNAVENINLKSDDYQEWNLDVPHWDMAKVAEGLTNSSISAPIGTSLVLQDRAYNIAMFIMWGPRFIDEEKLMCQLDAHKIILLHNNEQVRSWDDSDKYESINYRHIQNAINSIVEKDMNDVRKSGVDREEPYIKYWLTGRMIMSAVVPFPKSLIEE